MIHRRLFFLGLIAALVIPANSLRPADAKDELRDERTGLVFPREIKHFERGNVHRYKQPELGISVPYYSAASSVTVYVYTGGAKNIPDGIESRMVKSQFAKAKGEILKAQRAGHYRSVKPLGDSEIVLSGATNGIPALKSVFEIAQSNEDTLSVIILTARKNSFIKLRCTYPRYLKAQGEKSVEQFLKEFGQLIK